MGTLQSRRYCRECGQKTLHAKEYFSTGAGLVLTLFTAGLFLILWLLIAFVEAFKPWRCQTCGKARMW